MGGRVGRRWTEETPRPPLDLRLVIPALAVWAGCLVGLGLVPGEAGGASGGLRAAWRLGGLTVLGAVVALLAVWWVRRRRPGTAAALRTSATMLICGVAALVLTALRVGLAADDPLFVAATQGDWVRAEVVVRADPVPVAGGWQHPAKSADAPDPAAAVDDGGQRASAPITDTSIADDGDAGDPDGANAGRDSRWRVTAAAHRVRARGVDRGSAAPVTIFGSGPAWAQVRAGETVTVTGSTAVDEFSSFPAVTIRARADPIAVAGSPWWLAWAGGARQALTRSAAALGPDAGGLLRGLTVGDTRGIDAQLSADAKTTGLTHLVAVSGSHMAIVAGAVLLLLRRFGPRVAGLGVAATFAALVLLVGPQPSVLRSVAMGLIGILAAVLGRARTALSALAAAVFGLLLADPSLAVSVGFTLSVQATAGLVLLAPTMTAALRRRGVPSGWATILAMAVAAHLATVPVIAAISGTVSLAAIPANIAVAPAVAPALLVGLACLVVSPWWPGAGVVLARADAPLLGWITGVAHRLAAWRWASLPWSPGTAAVLGLALLIALAFALVTHRVTRRLSAAAAAGAALVLAAASVIHVGWPADGWLLTACDVGQGDAVVLATDVPGEAVVVDTGPDPELIDGCLDRLGIDTIALLVITHLHADHVGGIAGAVAGRTVHAIGIGPDRSSAAALRTIAAAAWERGATVTAMALGAVWQRDGLELDVLGPSREFHGTDSDPNNDSVVLRATRRDVRILLTGDIERPAQQSLLDRGMDLAADVLKQPHHGSSKLLPEFVAAVGARVAVVGVGARNDYGHPAPSALRADRAAGIGTILRTDTDGDVQVVLTGSGLGSVTRGSVTRGSVTRSAVTRGSVTRGASDTGSGSR